nr:hypothetical protein [Pseudopedobacter sp.]
MKPTKNRVFCKDCGRVKMLFETEKKAAHFIAFNQEEITMESGIAPQRSYFCQFCGGWHLTSIKEKIGQTKNEKLLEDYLQQKVANTGKAAFKANKQEKRDGILSELESQIKGMDTPQKDLYFAEKINILKKEIENLKGSAHPLEKKKMKEIRQHLELVYSVRKEHGLQNANQNYTKSGERELEEWKSWLVKKGYDKE